jgi:hypothetical protein
MFEWSPETDDGFDWARAYLALSRSGVVTPEIKACEAEWAKQFWGFAPARGRVSRYALVLDPQRIDRSRTEVLSDS